MNDLTQPLQYSARYRARHLDELMAFLRIPSIGTQPAHDEDTAAAAEWVARALRQAGLDNVSLITTPGQPLVYGDWLHAGPGAPTILIYGHYDVQPPDPLELWDTPPFEPDIRDDYIYARGSADDKGQLYIHIKAVQAYLETRDSLPVNVKFLIEGEEESGGESIENFIRENTELLAADVVVISDSSMLGPEQPSLAYGLRGNCYMLLDITGPTRDLHSGSYGGGIDNPLNVLGHIIARLKDQQGKVLIPGFYERVRPLSPEEREILAQLPFDEETWLIETGAPALWGEPEYSLVERLGVRPTLDVHGILGGYTGEGGKTVLPSHVHAKISMRLVPDQQPAEIARLFTNYVQSLLPPTVTAEIKLHSLSDSFVVDRDTPAMRAASVALEESFGRRPVYVRGGGTLPVVAQMQQDLGIDAVLLGFGLPDDRIHSPNERFYLPNFFKGIDTAIRFYHQYSDLETPGS